MTNFIKLLFSCGAILMKELMAAMAFVTPNLVTSMYGMEGRRGNEETKY